MKSTIEITWFDHKKGFGFAVSSIKDYAGSDIFVRGTSFIKEEGRAKATKGKRYVADLKPQTKMIEAYNIEEILE